LTVPSFSHDFLVVTGVEPSMRWRTFVGEILSLGEDLNISMVVSLGSLLADVPHTRPIPITLSAANADLAKRFEVEMSRYEGPTGILGAIQDGCNARDIDAVSLWAAIPHYVSAPPCPKATLALLNHLEDLLEINIPEGELPDDARAWELGATQIAEEDAEISEYVQSLEESKDAADLPEASGESIAREFERYLRHRGDESK
jgi:predicted ATP-grasp superfamily ATP-dependent carboligase